MIDEMGTGGTTPVCERCVEEYNGGTPCRIHKEIINHPDHYNHGKIETIVAIDDWDLDFCLGNAVKYIARAGHKGKPLDDLRKALWYIQHKIDLLQASQQFGGRVPESEGEVGI
jgi:hypothetical protein